MEGWFAALDCGDADCTTTQPSWIAINKPRLPSLLLTLRSLYSGVAAPGPSAAAEASSSSEPSAPSSLDPAASSASSSQTHAAKVNPATGGKGAATVPEPEEKLDLPRECCAFTGVEGAEEPGDIGDSTPPAVAAPLPGEKGRAGAERGWSEATSRKAQRRKRGSCISARATARSTTGGAAEAAAAAAATAAAWLAAAAAEADAATEADAARAWKGLFIGEPIGLVMPLRPD